MTGCEDVKGVKCSFNELTPPRFRSKHASLNSLYQLPKAASWCRGDGQSKLRRSGRTSQGPNEGALAKDIDQFINYSIFTLINSKGSLYQWTGSPSPSLLGHRRKCACQVGAGQGRRARSCRNTRSLDHTGHAKGSAEQAALSIWPLLRQGELPFLALMPRDKAGSVGISHAGESHGGKSGFQSIYRISSTGYHIGSIGDALYSAAGTST